MSWRRRSNRRSDDEDDSDELANPFDFGMRFGFEDIDEMIDSMMRAARSTMRGADSTAFGPVYYGYSVTVGPDGKPQVREFGNAKPTRRGTFEVGTREPFVDTVVDEKEGKLKVVAEMPGIQREDIHLEAMEDSLSIHAEHGDRKYDATVPLSNPVEVNSASATYNNGVLEVKLKLKGGQQKPKGVAIKID
jgi:HSP20 family protein